MSWLFGLYVKFPPKLGNLVCVWKSRGSSKKLHTYR
jgi:hypothetical protein